MNPLHAGNETIDLVVTILIMIVLPLGIYKVIMPVVAKLYKVALIFFGTVLSWIGFFGTLHMLAASQIGSVGKILLAILAAIALSAFTFLIASIIGRLEKLEGR